MFKTKQAGLVAIVVILTPGLARSGNELPFLGSECKPYLADRVSRRIVVNLCEDCSDPGSREALISSDLNLGRSVGIVKARSFFLTGKSNGFAPTAAHSETRPATGEGLAQVSDEIQKDYFGAPELDAEGKPTGKRGPSFQGKPIEYEIDVVRSGKSSAAGLSDEALRNFAASLPPHVKLKYVSAGEASVSAGEALRAGFQKASGEEACVCGTSFGEPSTFQGVENQWQKGLLDRAGDQFQSLLSSNYGAQTSGGISGGEALTSSERIAYDFFLKTAQGQQALKAASGSSIVSPRALEDASDALLKKFPVPKGRLPGTWQDGEASNRVVTELYGDRIGSEVLDAHARELSSPDVLEAVGDMQFRKITTPQYKMTGQLDLYGQPVPERVFDPVTLQWKYVRDPHPLMSYESHDISAREAGEYQYDPNDPSKFETKSDDKGITRTTQKRNVFMLDPNDDISPADSMQVKNEKIRRRRLMVLRKLAFEHATSRVDHTEDQQLALEALRLKNALRSKKLSIEERKEMAGELSMIRFQLEGSPVFTDGGSTSVEQILDQDSPSEADLSARRNAIIAEARSPAVDLESQLQLGRTLKARHNIEEAFMRSAPDDLRKAYTAARTCEIERFGSGRPSGGLEGSPETRVAKPAH